MCVISSPPMKKPMTAISDGHCKLLNPLMACPDVHPPAYLVPNPTRKPPTTRYNKDEKLNKTFVPNSCKGASSLEIGAAIFKSLSTDNVDELNAIGASVVRKY